MKTVAIYCRVSTAEQSADMQREDLFRYCTQRGFELFHVYLDVGISGALDRRPALDELMSAARKKRFDMVLVWRFDRFARSTKHLIAALEEFRHLDIDFISFKENIDTASPLGKAVFTIVGAMAELERNIITERIRAGIRFAKEQGKRLGRRPKIDAETLRTLQSIRAHGKSIRAIQKAIAAGGFFVSKSTVHQALKKWPSQVAEKAKDETS